MLLHTTTEAGYPAVYINGGSIAARSIYSAQIQANAIVAEHLRAGQISSDHISTAGITADNIKGKTLSSSVPVSSGGSFINLDTGNINFAGGNLTWDNTTKTFYINASTLQIGGKNVLNTDTDLAQQINNKGTTRIQGNKLYFTNQVLMDDAFIELLTANNIFAQRIDARDINANRITSGTLAADFIQGGTFNGQSMIVKNITADAIKGGTFDGQSMTIRNLTADAIVTGTLDMSKFNVSNLSADDIQTGNLDISGGLRVTSGRHQIMSIDPETLNLEFNVNKMTIGGIKLISEDDQPQMEENIANELEGKIKQYLHIAYADDASGNGFSTSPLNKSYLGIAVTNSATAPAYTGFTWSKYVGEDGSRGPQGLPGDKGTDGKTTYTWVRYADTPTSGMNQYPDGKKYIGLAFNKATQTESNSYSDYQWSLMPQNIEIGGRNLLRNSEREVSAVGGREFVRFADLAPIFEEHGLDEVYSLSLDLKSADISNNSRIQIYMQNGNGTRYNFVYSSVIVTKEYQRFKFEGLTPSLSNTSETRATLAFYGTYNTGNFPIIRRVKLEKGNIATDWTEAPEDTQAEIDEKASADDVASALMDLQQELEAAATASELSDFIQEYNKELAARESEKRDSESRLSKAQEAIDIITNNMRDRSESWNFLDRSISNTPEGMVIGNESTGSYLLIKEDKISFFSNGNEVAFISQNLMEISRGAFVEEIQISKYKLEGNTKDNHLTFRYVG